MDGQIPPPPDGYVMQPEASDASSVPPPPPGYQLQPAPESLPTVVVHPDQQDSSPSLFRRGYEDSAALLQNAVVRPLQGIAGNAAHALRSLTDAGASTAAPGSVGANIAQYVNSKVDALDNSIQGNEQDYQAAIPNRPDTIAAAGVGSVLPYVVGSGEVNLPRAATTLGKVALGTATGAGVGAMQPVTTGADTGPLSQQITGPKPSFADQKIKQMLAGGATGGAVPAIGAIPGALIGKATPEAQALAQKAADYGIDLNAPQVSKSVPLNLANSTTAPFPFSGAAAAAEKQQGQFNNAVAQTIGLPQGTTKITPDVFNQAKKTIGQGYDDLAARNNLNIDPPTISRIQQILGEAHTDGDPDAARAISNITQEIIGKASKNGSALTGPQFQSIDSRLGRLAAAGTGDKAHYAGELQDALRQSMEAGMSPADAAKSALLRSQWRNALNLTPILTAGDGDVPPSRLLAAVANNKAGKTQMATGTRGDLGTLAQIGKQFLKDPIPNSGTALRNVGMDTLKGLGAVGLGSAAGVSAASSLPAVGATITAARLIQQGLRSRALYNAVAKLPMEQQTPVRNALSALLSSQSARNIGSPSANSGSANNISPQANP